MRAEYNRVRKAGVIYLKAVLSALMALLVALIAGPWSPFRGITEQKTTGLAALTGGGMEALLSPPFWASVMVLFALIFAAGQIKNKVLQAILFWVPAIFSSVIALGLATLIIGGLLYLRHG